MKKIIICALFTISNSLFSQTISDLKFDTNVPDAENSYVVIPNKELAKNYAVGFIYFDQNAGYTFRSLGNLNDENGKLHYKENENSKVSFTNTRIGNLEFKTAKLSENLLKIYNLPSTPEWLKIYASSESDNLKILNRASFMNGANNPKLALPKLLKLYNENFKPEKLFFELIFSYNALRDFNNAEKYSIEALKTDKADDLIKKEYVYALVNQNKIDEADLYLTKNIFSFKTDNNKFEAIINIIASSAHNNKLEVANKWLEKLKSDPKSAKFQKNISQLENIIKEKQNNIK